MTSLSALPGFLSHFLAGLALLGAALMLYARFTPHDEVALIRAGNPAAAVSLGGTVVGFALPIGAAIAHSANLLDAVVRAAVALVAQARPSPLRRGSCCPAGGRRPSGAKRAPRR